VKVKRRVRCRGHAFIGEITSSSGDISASFFFNHSLSGTLGEGVSVPQVIDFDILDVISICDVHLTVDSGRWVGVGIGWRSRSRASGLVDRRDVDMLDTLAGGHRVDLAGNSSWRPTNVSHLAQ
jgi:hypothetical protein